MNFPELDIQNETNLLAVVSNTQADFEMRVYAAVLLYKRGSRFLAFEEFRKFKPYVIDYVLGEQADAPLKPFAPDVIKDMAGRLHQRLEGSDSSLASFHGNVAELKNEMAQTKAHVLVKHSEHESNLNDHRAKTCQRLEDHDKKLSDMAQHTADGLESVVSITEDLSHQIDRNNKMIAAVSAHHTERQDSFEMNTKADVAAVSLKLAQAEKIRDDKDASIVQTLDDHKIQNNSQHLSLWDALVDTNKRHDRAEDYHKSTQDSIVSSYMVNDEALRVQISNLRKAAWCLVPVTVIVSQIVSYLIKHFAR